VSSCSHMGLAEKHASSPLGHVDSGGRDVGRMERIERDVDELVVIRSVSDVRRLDSTRPRLPDCYFILSARTSAVLGRSK
jgi:hypothetical protein